MMQVKDIFPLTVQVNSKENTTILYNVSNIEYMFEANQTTFCEVTTTNDIDSYPLFSSFIHILSPFDKVVWSGVLYKRTKKGNERILQAADYSIFFNKCVQQLTVMNGTAEQIAQNIIEYVQNITRMPPLTLEIWSQSAYTSLQIAANSIAEQNITELEKSGLTWSVVNDKVFLGVKNTQPLVISSRFLREELTIIEDASEMVTELTFINNEQLSSSTTDIDFPYRLQGVIQALDHTGVNTKNIVETQVKYFSTPKTSIDAQSFELHPLQTLEYSQLYPNSCIIFSEYPTLIFRITSVTVSEDENNRSVSIDFEELS